MVQRSRSRPSAKAKVVAAVLRHDAFELVLSLAVVAEIEGTLVLQKVRSDLLALESQEGIALVTRRELVERIDWSSRSERRHHPNFPYS